MNFPLAFRRLSVSSTGSISLQHSQVFLDCLSELLSVSSTGSISLQHLDSEERCAHQCGLSVSSTGSISLQHLIFQAGNVCGEPFSILNRIDIPATSLKSNRANGVPDFQYPQPDRYPCNVLAFEPRYSWLHSFSILNRIDIPATAMGCPDAGSISSFSILNRIDIPAT